MVAGKDWGTTHLSDGLVFLCILLVDPFVIEWWCGGVRFICSRIFVPREGL